MVLGLDGKLCSGNASALGFGRLLHDASVEPPHACVVSPAADATVSAAQDGARWRAMQADDNARAGAGKECIRAGHFCGELCGNFLAGELAGRR